MQKPLTTQRSEKVDRLAEHDAFDGMLSMRRVGCRGAAEALEVPPMLARPLAQKEAARWALLATSATHERDRRK
jgi:hypothetical protein